MDTLFLVSVVGAIVVLIAFVFIAKQYHEGRRCDNLIMSVSILLGIVSIATLVGGAYYVSTPSAVYQISAGEVPIWIDRPANPLMGIVEKIFGSQGNAREAVERFNRWHPLAGESSPRK